MTVIRSNEDWVEACRARKVELGLSNALVEHKLPLAAGACDKYLGLMPIKTMSLRLMFEVIEFFGWEMVIRANPVAEDKWRPTWLGREDRNVRIPHKRLSRLLLERAKPLVLRQLGSYAGRQRVLNLTEGELSAIGRKGGLASARARRRRIKAALREMGIGRRT